LNLRWCALAFEGYLKVARELQDLRVKQVDFGDLFMKNKLQIPGKSRGSAPRDRTATTTRNQPNASGNDKSANDRRTGTLSKNKPANGSDSRRPPVKDRSRAPAKLDASKPLSKQVRFILWRSVFFFHVKLSPVYRNHLRVTTSKFGTDSSGTKDLLTLVVSSYLTERGCPKVNTSIVTDVFACADDWIQTNCSYGHNYELSDEHIAELKLNAKQSPCFFALQGSRLFSALARSFLS
jgi:hypothetical protein